MKHLKLTFLAALSLFVGGLRQQFATANVETTAGTHKQTYTKLADTTWGSQHLLVMAGTDDDHVTVCDGNHFPLGSTDDQPTTEEDDIQVNLFGTLLRSVLLTCATALANGVDLYADTANPGYVIALPTTAGTYYKVGTAIQGAQEVSSGLYFIEAVTQKPSKVVVIAAPTSAQDASTAVVSTTPTTGAYGFTLAQAEAIIANLNALQTAYNALQADYATLAAAHAAVSGVVVL